MADLSELETRLATLEKGSDRVSERWPLLLAVGLMLASVGLLVYQMTLLRHQQAVLTATSRQQLFWTLCTPATPVDERSLAFSRLVADGHSEWRSAATQGLQLRGSHLDRASLRGADLAACDLSGATFFRAEMPGVRLRAANLTGADFTEALLDGAECLRATIDDADFREAQFRSGSLEQVSGRKAKFVKADLSETYLLMADLTGADFTGANLTAAVLESARLRGATLALANLAEAKLKNADLTNSNWWRARGLTNAQLTQFAAEFPPTDNADPSRIKDYLLWAESFSSRQTNPPASNEDRPEP